MTINSIQINNYIQNKLPTLNAALESETWQKVAFVFLSVVTLGILPLSLVLYDLGKNLLSRRQVNVQNNNNRVIVANRPNAASNFSEGKVAAIIGAITGVALFSKIYFKKDFITPVASNFVKGVVEVIKNYPKETAAGAVALTGAYILKKAIDLYREEKNQPEPKKVKKQTEKFFKPQNEPISPTPGEPDEPRGFYFSPMPSAPSEPDRFSFSPIPSAPSEFGEPGASMYPNLQNERPLNPNPEGVSARY